MKGRHTSIDKSLKRTIKWLENEPCVTRIVLGLSEACRHKFPPGHIKVKMDVDAGIKLNAYSGKGITDIFIKIEPITARDTLKDKIRCKFMI